MPAGVPRADAPVSVWAGEYDAQQYADALGMSWIAPLFANSIPRVVNLANLCAVPKPSAPAFTTTDLATGLIPGAGRDAAQAKLETFVDAYLWTTYCVPADDPAPPPDPPQPPPADAPIAPPVPVGIDKMMRDMWYWLNWMKEQFVPREYQAFDPQTVSGSGTITFNAYDNGEWRVWPAGVKVVVDAKPDYAGQSHSGSPAVWFDLGYFSIGDAGCDGEPIRLQRLVQVVYGQTLHIVRFTYNLLPDTTITVLPMYPVTARPIE